MIQKIKDLFQKHREVLLYLVFGVLTTAVDWVVSYLLYFFWGDAILYLTVKMIIDYFKKPTKTA